jgi:hypothetical protein
MSLTSTSFKSTYTTDPTLAAQWPETLRNKSDWRKVLRIMPKAIVVVVWDL